MSTIAARDSSPAPLVIRLFGPFETRVNGDRLPRLRSLKGQWLLALLTLHGNREVERDWLAGLLWPDSSERAAFANLRCSLKDLRRALDREAARLRSPTPRTLCLDLSGAAVDLLAFDVAIARGDLASLRHAAELYRGPLLERCAEEWVFLERQSREEAYLQALETLAAQAMADSDSEAAAGWLRRAVTVDPLRESAQRSLMQALAGGGNYGAALLAYRELRRRLHREINAEPDRETQAAFARIRCEGRGAQRAVQRRSAAPASSGLEAGAARPCRTAPGHLFQPPAAREVALPAIALCEALQRGRMVERDAELAELARRIETALGGEGSVALLAGEPGIGKTRLAKEACAWAWRWGFRVLTGRCEGAGAAPYQPFVEATREYLDTTSPEQAEGVLPAPIACELVRLVPRIAEKVREVPRVAAAVGAAAQHALVEAMGEFFALLTARQGPVLLFLDDLHWADEGSLALLHTLTRRAKEQRLLIVGTYRDLPPDLRHPLEEALAALNRERLAERRLLHRLSETAVAEMVSALLDDEGISRQPSAVGKHRPGVTDGRKPGTLLRGSVFYLRLERTGDRFTGLCSTDGSHWLTCGQTIVPMQDPLRLGKAALNGMVVNFDSVQVLGRG